MCFCVRVTSSNVGPSPHVGEVGVQPLPQGLLASAGSQMEVIISKHLLCEG